MEVGDKPEGLWPAEADLAVFVSKLGSRDLAEWWPEWLVEATRRLGATIVSTPWGEEDKEQ